MPRLTPTSAWPALGIFLAAGTWWLANISLQAGSSFAAASAISAQAAFALVLGQWILISLFASHGDCRRFSATTVASLNFVVPLWPLLALLWLTSDVSMITLVQTQLIAFTLAVILAVVGTRVTRLNIDDEFRTLLLSTVGIIVAMTVWIGRSRLLEWVTA